MRVAEIYSHKGGLEYIKEHHNSELDEIYTAIESLDGTAMLCKTTNEKTKPPLLFSPVEMNNALKRYLCVRGWTDARPGTKKGFAEPRIKMGEGAEFREMDGIKNKVGLEIQFGKYAFMAYDILGKMPIFAKRGLIDCGIEVVAMPSLVRNMSTGVSSFNQIKADLTNRGVADLDIPTLVLGIDCTEQQWQGVVEKRARYDAEPSAMRTEGSVLAARKGAAPGPKN